MSKFKVYSGSGVTDLKRHMRPQWITPHKCPKCGEYMHTDGKVMHCYTQGCNGRRFDPDPM